MKTVQILEDHDLISPEDWCRPLQILPMSPQSDYYSFQSHYGNSPANNAKWVKVKYILGPIWYGKPVKNLNQKLLEEQYEFVRGEVPEDHILNMNGYSQIDYSV
jgi:hypothetical protein